MADIPGAFDGPLEAAEAVSPNRATASREYMISDAGAARSDCEEEMGEGDDRTARRR